MNARGWIFKLGLVLFLVAVGSGCGSGENAGGPSGRAGHYPLPNPPLVSPRPPGRLGGRFVIGAVGDPKTLNPITSTDLTSRNVWQLMLSSLVNFDWPSQEVKPGLLESWSVAPDQKTWTLRLRKGLLWSDGQPLTADDVVFTWNDVVYNPKIINMAIDSFRIGGKKYQVSRIDDDTIRVVTPEISAPFLESLGDLVVLPKHALERTVAEGKFDSSYSLGGDPAEMICSGPFRLKEVRPGQYALLTRNPYFWEVDQKGQRLPYFDNVIFMVAPDMNALSLRFLRGETDENEFVRPEEYDYYKAQAAGGRFRFLELGVGLERSFLWFNQNTATNAQTGRPYVDSEKLSWFRNRKFRQAIACAIDRPAIVNSVYAGRAEPAYGFETPRNTKWYNPNIQKYPYDLAKARQLLKEIGIEDRNGDGILEDARGRNIEFVFNTNTGNNAREKTAVLIQEDLKKLGISVIYQPLDFNTLIDKSDHSDYDCILMGLGGGSLDPAAAMNVLTSNGSLHFWFPREPKPSTPWEARIDELMEAQLKTLDVKERKKDYDEVQRILSEQMPLIYTVTPQVFAAIRSDIGNVIPTALSYNRVTWNLEELFFRIAH